MTEINRMSTKKVKFILLGFAVIATVFVGILLLSLPDYLGFEADLTVVEGKFESLSTQASGRSSFSYIIKIEGEDKKYIISSIVLPDFHDGNFKKDIAAGDTIKMTCGPYNLEFNSRSVYSVEAKGNSYLALEDSKHQNAMNNLILYIFIGIFSLLAIALYIVCFCFQRKAAPTIEYEAGGEVICRFYGQITKTNHLVKFKKAFLPLRSFSWSTFAILFVLTIFYIATNHRYWVDPFVCTVLLSVLSLLFTFLPRFLASKSQWEIYEITLENNYIVCMRFESGEDAMTLKHLSTVKKVVDFGNCYIVGDYICQKNLLTDGSLEDFERAFENKIVRKQ